MSVEILNIYKMIDYIKDYIINDSIGNIKQFEYFKYENLVVVISNGLTNSSYKNNIISIEDYEIIIDKLATMNKSVDISYLIAFDSFDGVNHLETVEDKIDLVSFNTTFVNQHLLSKLEKYSTARSNTILTWI